MANSAPRSAAAMQCEARRRRSLRRRSGRGAVSPNPWHSIRPLLLLAALVNFAWSLYQLPVSRVVESRLCREHYAARDPSALRPDGSVPEELCKVDDVQQRLGRIQGASEMMWVAGDFFMTIPLVSLADRYGHRFVLLLNLVPRVFLLAWTFAVGYLDRVLPVNAILAAPVFSFLGGDCVFNSILYALVSDLTNDHVLRATFFGYVNAVSSVFSLQLGPAIASATMTALLWLPLWIGTAVLLLAVPVVCALPPLKSAQRHKPASEDEDGAGTVTVPLLPTPAARRGLGSTVAARLRSMLSLVSNPSRNFALLLAVFFLASLASSDTKLLPLYISKRYTWKFSSVGYLLSAKAVFNFFLLSILIPRYLRWRSSSPPPSALHASSSHPPPDSTTTGAAAAAAAAADATAAADKQTVSHAHTSLALSVIGATAIALSPTVATLVPSLLVYALGIALPMFTYSLLRSPCMGLRASLNITTNTTASSTAGNDTVASEEGAEDEGRGGGAPSAPHLFSAVMLVRTVGTLLGAALMPNLWVAGLRVGGWALGLPFFASALCYGLAGMLVKRIEVGISASSA